ncbi:MAG TPA: MMPL family transporter, partial [Acidimicrobiales bacterium]|nr:MMPL family transporter [Acidimicrobiales bacterium]
RPLAQAGLDVQYGGQFDALFQPKASDAASELIGFAVALVVLLVGYGSVAAGILPLVTALLAMLVGLNILGIVSAALTFGTASPTLATMIGLGVGIDYAVFLTTRHRQSVIDGRDPVEAAALAASTSGRAVLVAATTVSIALLGLFASGIAFLGYLGLAAVFGVVAAALGAITLVPAALGLLGHQVDRLRVKKSPVAETGKENDWWHDYATSVGKRPWLYLAGGVMLLAVIAVPLLSVRLGTVDDGANPATYTSKQAYDLIARGFGPGANGPFTVVVKLRPGMPSGPAEQLATSIDASLARTPGVARASHLSPTEDGALLVGTVVPSTGPQTSATSSLFSRLDRQVLPAALKGSGAVGYVSGSTASNIQFAAKLTSSLPIVIAVVVACAFLLIMTAFRSLLLAVKAALCNLVSISAAYGVVVAVYQWGWGRSLFGVSENVPIESYVPVFMFAIVFGLSMDYEIFLLSRVKEQWDLTGDHRLAVARGLSATGRVITCAALIMASVFFAFVASSNVVVKQLAVGLSASVLLDATVVRLLLVPAVMYLLGTRSWWLPGWLDRSLPHIEVEPAPSPRPPRELAPLPAT